MIATYRDSTGHRLQSNPAHDHSPIDPQGIKPVTQSLGAAQPVEDGFVTSRQRRLHGIVVDLDDRSLRMPDARA